MTEFRILGPLEVCTDRGPVVLPGRKPRALLARLLLAPNEPLSADRLALELWGESAPSRATNTVQVHISRLRKALLDPGIVSTTAGGYRVNVGADELDAARFERLVELGRRALAADHAEEAAGALRTALGLWRGPPLADLSWESFAQGEIARLEEQRLSAIELRVQADLAAGRAVTAVGELQQLVAVHTTRERFVELLMLALYRAGRQGEALAAYTRVRRRLREDLGLEPGVPLQTLQAQILTQSPTLQPAVSAPGREPAGALPPGMRAEAPDIALPRALRARAGGALFGREQEVALLRTRWRQVSGDAHGVLVICGEAGIGKTRLASELARDVHRAGTLVLYGRCDDGLAIPYQPFVEALRPYAAAVGFDGLSRELGPLAGALERLWPGLTGDARPAVADPELERLALYDAVAALLATATRKRPALLVLDDLHWAAIPTLSLLRHILRSPPALNALVLCTLRDTELDPEHPLAQLLTDAQGDIGVERVTLRGLDEPAIAALVKERAGPALDDRPELCDVLREQTAGNPFYIHELLSHCAESQPHVSPSERLASQSTAEDQGLPERLSQVILHRVTRLSKPARWTLTVAAVAGQVTSLALLERLVEPEAELLDALDQATAAGLLSEAGPGEYVFTHALVRQAIYEELSATRRTRLHRRVGEALETVDGLEGGDGHAEALAHHFAAAAADGQCSKAAVYALAAGDSAITRLGYHEAAGYYELGAKALDAAGRQVDGQLCRLLLGLAEARSAAGDHRAAQSAQRRAADVAKQLGDTELLARQMVILGRLRRALGRSTDGRRSIDQARRLAHDTGDALTEFSALVDLGYVTNTSDLENGLALLERAERLYHRELAPRGSDASAELARDYQRLQGHLAIAEFDVWRFGAAARRMTACIPQMRKQGMGHDLPRMLGILGQLHTATGCFEQARDALWEGISMFGQRRDNIALRAYVRCLLGKLHLEMGRLDLAHAELARALTEVHKAGHEEYAMSVRLYLAELLLRVGQLRGASAHLDAVLGTAAGGGYPNLLPVVRSLAATIALASGDRVTALELSWVAVQALAPRRRLVLVRSEELFVRHARILRAVGDDAGAREWIAHALGVLREKERSIATPEVRHRFLTRVPLNRALLREAQALAV